jgi:hypothetical protein
MRKRYRINEPQMAPLNDHYWGATDHGSSALPIVRETHKSTMHGHRKGICVLNNKYFLKMFFKKNQY